MKSNCIYGISTNLIEISEIDSKVICELRNNPKNNKFLSSTKKITISEQEKWITSNLKLNDGFYFKIIDKIGNEIVGTISLYNVKDNSAEFGRYICNKTIQAVESELLLIKFGFEIMKLNRIYCKTVENNKLVWNQHYKYGFKDTGIEYFSKNGYYLKVQELSINDYKEFDYSKISQLINVMNK